MLVIIWCRIFCVQFAIEIYKDYDMQNNNFACCFVCMWNTVSNDEGIQEQGAEEDIWA